jgi:hypothetical protein
MTSFSERESFSLCSVCGTGSRNGHVMICTDCVSPDQVRTFCRKCNVRHNLTVNKAADLFGAAGINVVKTGLVYCFDNGCPQCSPLNHVAPLEFEVVGAEFGPGYLA